MPLPFITVVMPVRNEERFIARTLGQLLDQDYPPERFEIIVADGGSTDRTREIVKEIIRTNPQVVLMENPRHLSSAGRNLGFRNGRGDYFIVVDGHCWIPTRMLFKNMLECFGKSGADCLGRPQPLDPPDVTVFQKAVALARASRLGHSGDSLIYSDYEGFCSPVSHGAMYRRSVFEKVGYVDETFDACEDVEFNYRLEKAGLKTYMSPALTIRYYPRESLLGLLRQMIRYGRGRIRLWKKHPGLFRPQGLAPLAVPALLFSAPLWAVVPAGAAFLAWGLAIGSYCLLLAAESTRLGLRHGLSLAPWIFFSLIAVHMGLGLGLLLGLWEAIAGRPGGFLQRIRHGPSREPQGSTKALPSNRARGAV